MRANGKRWLEWLSVSLVHYSGLDRRIGPLHREPGDRVSVVMYHRVHPDGPGPAWRLTRSVFQQQIAHLTRNYEVMAIDDVVACLTEGRRFPRRAVAVTFDDGYRDNVTEAFPVVRELSCPMTIFLTAGLIGTTETLWWDKLLYVVRNTAEPRTTVERVFADHGAPPPDWRGPDVEAAILAFKQLPEGGMQEAVDAIAARLGVDPTRNAADHMMSWDEARMMADSGLVTMGAHTMTHRNLKKLDLDDARREIVESKRRIEQELARPVDLFAYPFGNPANDYTDAVKGIVRAAGFTSAFSIVFGIAGRGADPYEIPRFCESVERWQAPAGGFSRALFDSYLTGAREHLGDLRPDRLLRRSA